MDDTNIQTTQSRPVVLWNTLMAAANALGNMMLNYAAEEYPSIFKTAAEANKPAPRG